MEIDNILKEAERFMAPADYARLVNHLAKGADEQDEFVNIEPKGSDEDTDLEVDDETVKKIKNYS